MRYKTTDRSFIGHLPITILSVPIHSFVTDIILMMKHSILIGVMDMMGNGSH